MPRGPWGRSQSTLLAVAVVVVFVPGRFVVAHDGDCAPFQRLPAQSLAAAAVANVSRPLVLTGITETWLARHKWRSPTVFSALYGRAKGYSRDHDQLELRDVDMTIAEYLNESVAGEVSGRPAVNLSRSAAFFVNDYEDNELISQLQKDYAPPPLLEDLQALRVFSLEKPGAGVAFHRHEASWQAQVLGQKAWFLAAPVVEALPQHSPCSFHAAGTAAAAADGSLPPMVEECTVHAGEVLYVPSGWWHATCTARAPTIAIGGVGSMRSWPAALVAARQGDLANLPPQEVVDAMALPDGSGIFVGGEHALYLAAAFGHASAVDLLLARGADPNVQRRDGRAALHEAARRGDVVLLEKLRASGGNLSLVDSRGSTALHHACAERGSVSALRYLLSHGVPAGSRLSDRRTALHVACRGHTNPVPLLRVLLQDGQVPPSPRTVRGATPLMDCAAAGHAQGVGLLLRFGGLEAARFTDVDGRDALAFALEGRGDAGVVMRLLAAGLPARGRQVVAARLGGEEILPLLVAAGASPHGAVTEAARWGHAATVQNLVGSIGGDIEEPDPETGATPLHAAALAGHLPVVHALTSMGANVSSSDQYGFLPLHYAAMSAGQVQVTKQFKVMAALATATRGSDGLWQRVGKQGLSLLHLVAATGDMEMARWLVKERRVADPGVRDDTGKTPADAAIEANHTELASLLHVWQQESLSATQGEL